MALKWPYREAVPLRNYSLTVSLQLEQFAKAPSRTVF